MENISGAAIYLHAGIVNVSEVLNPGFNDFLRRCAFTMDGAHVFAVYDIGLGADRVPIQS